MSILSALKQQNSSIDDLAKLPQAMIMQMAQKKEISPEMVAPILSRKAEMMEAVARSKALQQPAAQPSVMEQVMAKNIQAENPANAMPPQAPQAMPQAPEEAGVAQIPIPERQYAGGGIIAFSRGDLVDLDEEDDDNDILAEYAQAMAEGDRAMQSGNAGVGIKAALPKEISRKGGEHPYESLVTAKAREFGVDPRLASYILNKETGGMKNPESARSPAGAMGIAQFMPATAKQYGINPDIPEEAAMGMGKHLRYLMDKYDDPKLAAIAYNWGEGNTNKWLKAGADMGKLPKETQRYVAQLAEGGEIKHFATGDEVRDARQRQLAAIGAVNQALPEDMPADYAGSYSDYLQSDAAKERQRERDIALNAIKGNIPIPSLTSAILSPSVPKVPVKTTETPAAAAPKTTSKEAPKVATSPSTPAIPQAGLTPEEMMLGSTRAGTWNALNKDTTTGMPIEKAVEQKNRFDQFLDDVAQGRKDLAEQRRQDQNMALLASGLGMLGGTSQYAFENIGKGGLAGVQYLSEANKQRAAEKGALDKSEVAALRYKDLADISRGGRESTLGVRMAELTEKQRAHNLTSLNQLEKNALAKATAALKSQGLLGTDLNDPQTQQMLNEWVQKDLANNKAYNKIYQETFGFGYDVSPSTSGGNVIKFDKKGNPIK